MTKRKAERMTGYEVRELPPEGGIYTVGAFEGERLIEKAEGRADFMALEALVRRVLASHSRRRWSNMAGDALGADPAAGWRSITESIVHTGERTAWRTSSLFAGTVTSSSIGPNAPNEAFDQFANIPRGHAR